MIIPSTQTNGFIIISIGLLISLPIFLWSFKCWKRERQAYLKTDASIDKYLLNIRMNVSNLATRKPYILQIGKEVSTEHPPIGVNTIWIIFSLIAFIFGCSSICLWANGRLAIHLNTEWVSFYITFVLLPLCMLILAVLERKFYRVGRSYVAKEAESFLYGDVNAIFDSCEDILIKIMKVEIIKSDNPKLLKAKLGRSDFTIEISKIKRKGKTIVRLYVLSDVRGFPTKFDKNTNQANIDTFQTYLLSVFEK